MSPAETPHPLLSAAERAIDAHTDAKRSAVTESPNDPIDYLESLIGLILRGKPVRDLAEAIGAVRNDRLNLDRKCRELEREVASRSGCFTG